MNWSEDVRQWAGPVPAPSASELADRYAVSQLVKIYALGVDMRDIELALSPFSDDAYLEGTAGAAPVREYLPKVCGAAAVYHATQHIIANQYVSLEGDTALVWSYAVAYHIESPASGRENLVVGVIYRDRCRKFAKGWAITARKVTLQWVQGPFPRKES